MESSQTIKDQLAHRKTDLMAQRFKKDKGELLLLTSSSDIGVLRNGGRRGAAHGPTAIISQLKKLIAPDKKFSIQHIETAKKQEEAEDFVSSQIKQAERIKNSLSKDLPILHLGGGHDHIYPLIKALLISNPNKSIHILNLDAHLDTRQDKLFHSGTPFRQLANEYPMQVKITQIGIHSYTNARENYQNMPCEMSVWEQDKWNDKEVTSFFKTYKDDLIFLSLDADGLHANIMEAVSAVNHLGLDGHFVVKLFNHYLDVINKKDWMIGIYEYNPLFDNLSNKGSRYLASLIYQIFDKL